MNTSAYRFFKIAIWVPAALFLSLPLLEHLSRGTQNFESMFLTYGLWFGTLAYLIFAMWATWHIKKKPEPVIARLIWWAPVIFIPFYGVPWILYGLFHIAMGETSGIGMALLWVALSPYIIVVGYVFSAATFVGYELFFKSTDFGHEVLCETTNVIQSMAGDAKFFGNRFEQEALITGGETFSFYPRKIFLGHQGLFAYHAMLMIADSEFGKFCELIGGAFDLATIKQDQEATYLNSDGAALQLAVRQEFNGLIIEMITNSKVLLEGLDASFKAPPPPWLAFPQMEPIEAVMGKQGSLDYWWNAFWKPFWENANAETRVAYLRDHEASEEWAECLAGHTANTD